MRGELQKYACRESARPKRKGFIMCVRCGEANSGDGVLIRIGDAPNGKHSGEGDGYMMNSNGKRECYHHSMICDECALDFMAEWNRGTERVRERKIRRKQDAARMRVDDVEEKCRLLDKLVAVGDDEELKLLVKADKERLQVSVAGGEFKDVEFDNPDDYDQPTD
jgi:hypothetical protein